MMLIYLVLYLLYEMLREDKTRKILVHYVKEYSYWGIKEKMNQYHLQYHFNQYLIHGLQFTCFLGLISYLSLDDFWKMSFLWVIVILCIPYYQWMRVKENYRNQLLQEVFIYVSSGILFIQEKKNSLRILKDCHEIIKYPLQEVIGKSIKEIEKTARFDEALTLIEKDFPQQIILKFHVLLRSIKNEGGYNSHLYQYLYQNVEDLEMNINQYQIKKQNQRKVFYMMVVMNFLVALSLKKLFNMDDPNFDWTLILFYGLNFITILYYEHWCFNQGVSI